MYAISCDYPSSCFGVDRLLVYEGNPSLLLPWLPPPSLALCCVRARRRREPRKGRGEEVMINHYPPPPSLLCFGATKCAVVIVCKNASRVQTKLSVYTDYLLLQP